MRFTPLDELPAARGQADALCLGFPFACERAAGEGDPSLHRRRDAEELFLLALLALAAISGPPDYPDRARQTPTALRSGDGPLAAWDHDYHVEILEVVAGPGGDGLSRVVLRRHDPSTPRSVTGRSA